MQHQTSKSLVWILILVIKLSIVEISSQISDNNTIDQNQKYIIDENGVKRPFKNVNEPSLTPPEYFPTQKETDRIFEEFDHDHNAEDPLTDEFSQQLVKDMGWYHKNVTVTREQFQIFISRLLTKDEKIIDKEEKEFYDLLTEKLVNNAPLTFPSADLDNYITSDVTNRLMEEVMKEKFGVDSLEQLKEQMEGVKESLSENDHIQPPNLNEQTNEPKADL